MEVVWHLVFDVVDTVWVVFERAERSWATENKWKFDEVIRMITSVSTEWNINFVWNAILNLNKVTGNGNSSSREMTAQQERIWNRRRAEAMNVISIFAVLPTKRFLTTMRYRASAAPITSRIRIKTRNSKLWLLRIFSHFHFAVDCSFHCTSAQCSSVRLTWTLIVFVRSQSARD